MSKANAEKKLPARKIKNYETMCESIFNSLRKDMSTLQDICRADFNYFRKYIPYDIEGDYYFQDNGANVLAVAHLDTVLESSLCAMDRLNGIIVSPELDDRLGAYVILEVLSKFNIKYDILLTNNEEKGQTTAKKFKTDKKYNWVFEWDRAGDSHAAMYSFRDKKSEDLLEKYGFKVEHGTFTDICALEHLGCKAFNFAVSYKGQHTNGCYATLHTLAKDICKFMAFYFDNHTIHLAHEKAEIKVFTYQNKEYWENYNKGYSKDSRFSRGDNGYASTQKICSKCQESLWRSDEYIEGICRECKDAEALAKVQGSLFKEKKGITQQDVDRLLEEEKKKKVRPPAMAMMILQSGKIQEIPMEQMLSLQKTLASSSVTKWYWMEVSPGFFIRKRKKDVPSVVQN